MNTRTLGSGGPAVSALGLGCIGMSGLYGAADDEESIRTLHRALELGCNFWDTAEAYGPNTNELLLSRAMAGRREQVFIATKCGVKVDFKTMQRSVDGSPESVRRSCEGSLKRLGVERIDLYYLQRVDPATPIEETIGAMADLVHEGKVRYVGLCEAGPDTIRRAHRVHPLTALQTEYSLWSRDVEAAVLPTLRELDIALVAYAPLGHGFLSGRIRGPHDLADKDVRRSQPRYAPENLDHNLESVARIEELALEKGITPAQLALAWVLHQGPDVVAIPGTKRVKYLEENLAAADVQLTAGELARIAQLVPEPAGERYDAGGMRTVGL